MGPSNPLSNAADGIMRNMRIKAIEKELSPGELQIVNYHRDNVKNGRVGRDAEGRPVTVYSNTVLVPSGRFAGQYATVPGFFDGGIHDDENVIANRWLGEIEKGRWPVYRDPKEGDARAKFLHQIMDLESP